MTFDLTPLLILLFSVLSAASIAIRRLIGVTEVKKTGSSYGNQEAKKQNWRVFLPSPPPCSAAIRTVAPRCLTPTPTRFSSHCPVSRQVWGGDSAVKRKLETRVRLLKELEREREWKVWGFKLSAVTQIMRGGDAVLYSGISLNPASEPTLPVQLPLYPVNTQG